MRRYIHQHLVKIMRPSMPGNSSPSATDIETGCAGRIEAVPTMRDLCNDNNHTKSKIRNRRTSKKQCLTNPFDDLSHLPIRALGEKSAMDVLDPLLGSGFQIFMLQGTPQPITRIVRAFAITVEAEDDGYAMMLKIRKQYDYNRGLWRKYLSLRGFFKITPVVVCAS